MTITEMAKVANQITHGVIPFNCLIQTHFFAERQQGARRKLGAIGVIRTGIV